MNLSVDDNSVVGGIPEVGLEVEDEILAHLETRGERKLSPAGLSPEEARRKAQRQFGGIEKDEGRAS